MSVIIYVLFFASSLRKAGKEGDRRVGKGEEERKEREQGRRHNFKSGTVVGVQISQKNFGGCTPTYDILRGTTDAKRHTKSLAKSVTQEYACYYISC